tara:strand:- start:1579 stop:2007 length:429 start_codon:yes stop_codon:yes gene_type:complete
MVNTNQNKVIVGFSANEFSALVKLLNHTVYHKDSKTLRSKALKAMHTQSRKRRGAMTPYEAIKASVNRRFGVSDFHKSNGKLKADKRAKYFDMVEDFVKNWKEKNITQVQKDRHELLRVLFQAKKEIDFPVLAENNRVVITR